MFCDIVPDTCNLDPAKVEALISPKTTAILPVHVYGNPCDVHRLQEIADTYGLKILYDAAHAFGVEMNGESILNFGDLSMLSFHATKVFNTGEGGALITSDPELKRRIDYLKNFGFADETTVVGPGSNGKMNELQAALGIVQLAHVDQEIASRAEAVKIYTEQLQDTPGISLLPNPPRVTQNYGYMPIFVDEKAYGSSRDDLYFRLRDAGMYSRRYFYPLISEFPPYRGLPSASSAALPQATARAQSVICLPVYGGIDTEEVLRVCEIINRRMP